MSSRRYVVNRSDHEHARQIRETFYDKPVEKQVPINWSWPRSMLYVGQLESVQYTSDKWKKKGNYEDYKHVAEGPQRLYVRDGFLVDYDSSRPLGLPCEKIALPRSMPQVIAELAPALGIQFQSLDDDLELNSEYFNVAVARAYVGAARLPDSGETFLMIYTRGDLCAIITGDILDVEKDGIVG